MTDDSGAEYVGVKIGPGGRRDFSRALIVIPKAENQGTGGLQAVIQTAEASGIGLDDLRQLRTALAMAAGEVLMRRGTIVSFSKNHSVDAAHALQLVRDFRREEIRQNEKGLLYHYHQLPIDKLESAVTDGLLMSSDTQKALGRKVGGTSRPDVVQMTRDKYDTQGKLIRRGLGEANLMGDDMVTWVLKPSVMELPGYDATGEYPDLPQVQLQTEYVEAVLVSKDSEIPRVQELLSQNKLGVRVATWDSWKEKHYIDNK